MSENWEKRARENAHLLDRTEIIFCAREWADHELGMRAELDAVTAERDDALRQRDEAWAELKIHRRALRNAEAGLDDALRQRDEAERLALQCWDLMTAWADEGMVLKPADGSRVVAAVQRLAADWRERLATYRERVRR